MQHFVVSWPIRVWFQKWVCWRQNLTCKYSSHIQTLTHDFFHDCCQSSPFGTPSALLSLTLPFVLSLSAERERLEDEEKKVGGYLYWVAPPLSPGHWEWANTKPPLLTSALKHPVRHEQARRLCHCSNLSAKFQTSVNVQSDSRRQNLPAASSRPVHRYLRDTGTVLTSTLKCFSIMLMVL